MCNNFHDDRLFSTETQKGVNECNVAKRENNYEVDHLHTIVLFDSEANMNYMPQYCGKPSIFNNQISLFYLLLNDNSIVCIIP